MKKLLSSIAVAAAMISATAVQAGPVVTQWGYNVASNWNTGSTVFGPGASAGQINSNDLISWGGTGNHTIIGQNPGIARSAIAIEAGTLGTPSVGLVNTNGTALPPGGTPIGLGSLVAHYNNTLNASFSTLKKTRLTSTLTLNPNLPTPSGPLPAFSVGFGIDFIETSNVAGSCFTGSVTTCDDIFVLDLPSLSQSFTFDGNVYTVNQFTTSGTLGPLSNAACAAAGVASGCIGFVTEEGKRNEAQFGFNITVRPQQIPEPGSIALLGLGLLGVAAIRRRKASV
jgi:PEP-CTERM motif